MTELDYRQGESAVAGRGRSPAEEERLAALVRRFHAGEGYAFDALIEQVTPAMVPVISRFVWNRDDAQDVMQEVAIQLYRSLPRFRGDCQVSTFVYRVTLNVCMNCRKKLARGPLTFTDLSTDDGDFDARLPAADPTPEHTLHRREKQAALHQAIMSLPPQFRAVIVLADVCGMKYEEIAEITQAPLNTVRTRIKRAREAMKEKILARRELFGGGE